MLPVYAGDVCVCDTGVLAARYYDALHTLHPYETTETITSMASVNLVQAALKARDEDGIPVVGIDIAGAERGPIRVRVRELKGLGLVLVLSLSLGSW